MTKGQVQKLAAYRPTWEPAVTRLRWPLTAILFLLDWSPLHSQLAAPLPPSPPRGVIFVVNGAGGFVVASRALEQILAEDHIPLAVETFVWTHGYYRIASDHMHGSHTRSAGMRLAQEISRWKQMHPSQRIFLVAHSAGCAVTLYAAEQLPPDTIERIVLLAPAVSVNYDLRPSLRASCLGIDVFFSEKDWACLGIGVCLTGTTDRHWSVAAGKVGFRVHAVEPGDEKLFAKLRQYPWNPTLACTGNTGGHYGSHHPGFLKLFVIPLLWPEGARTDPSPRSLPGPSELHPG